MKSITVAVALAIFPLLGCGHPQSIVFQHLAEPLVVRRPALFPETIEYSAKRDKFLLGSFREGAVYEVDRDGRASVLVDDRRLCSVLGIAIDEPRNRLWAVNSDVGACIKPSVQGPAKLAGVGVYDLSSGKPIDYFDLAPLAGGPHLLNGIAVDASGDAYVTDSLSPIIYKIDSNGPGIFLHDDRFTGQGINLNGIIVHPDGYLLVVKKSDGTLYKVPLAEPARFSNVAIAERFEGGDGLTLVGRTTMVLIANRTAARASNAAFVLASEDGWRSAKLALVQQLGDVYPTTAVLREDTIYVVYSKLNELIELPREQKGHLGTLAAILPLARVVR